MKPLMLASMHPIALSAIVVSREATSPADTSKHVQPNKTNQFRRRKDGAPLAKLAIIAQGTKYHATETQSALNAASMIGVVPINGYRMSPQPPRPVLLRYH